MFLSLPEVKFLGQVIDSEGIRSDPDKVSAIRHVPEPTNMGDVRRFLGMVNQLSTFSPNLAERASARSIVNGYEKYVDLGKATKEGLSRSKRGQDRC